MKTKTFFYKLMLPVLLALVFTLPVHAAANKKTQTTDVTVPAYSGDPYYVVNDNTPFFNESQLVTRSFENYTAVDKLGRCGIAYANICKEIMPTEKRGAIGSVKPSGWKTVKYNGVVEGNYLYNRCHLIGYQLAGENANKKNLITGTRYMNVEGMLPFENMVDDYVEEGDNVHVLYRVTPIFSGNNLVADGVLMEAYSVEDKGEGICFNIFCYNVQPGVVIDYASGNSSLGKTVKSAKDISFAVQTPKNQVKGTDSGQNKVTTESNKSKTENNTDSNNSKTENNTDSNKSKTQSSTKIVTEKESKQSSKADTGKTQEKEVQTQQTPQASGQMVWLSATGSKYHNKNNCGRMNPAKARQVTLEQAVAEGMGPCSKCF